MSNHKSEVFLYFDTYTCQKNQQEVYEYAEWVMKRLIPAFGEWDDEVESSADQWLEAVSQVADPEDIDPSDAYEHGIEKALFLSEINGYMLLMALVGLYHLWERQLFQFLRKELNHYVFKKQPRIEWIREAKECLTAFGVNLEDLPCYSNLEELSLVANAVKHGLGISMDKLIKRKSDILLPAAFRTTKPFPDLATLGEDSSGEPRNADLLVTSGSYTLTQVDIEPTLDHIERYKQAVLGFWDHDYWLSVGEYQYLIVSDD